MSDASIAWCSLYWLHCYPSWSRFNLIKLIVFSLFLLASSLHGVVAVWNEPMLIQCGLLMYFTLLCGFLLGCATQLFSLRIYLWFIFIYRKCMVQNLWFFLSMASWPFSIMDHFRFKLVCCASDSLGMSGTLYLCILVVTWPPFLQIHNIWIFCWRLWSVFSWSSWTWTSRINGKTPN